MTDSIIVYRNPVEAAIWENLLGSNILFPIMCSGIVAVVVVVCLANLLDKKLRRVHRTHWIHKYGMNVVFAIAVIVAILTFNTMT